MMYKGENGPHCSGQTGFGGGWKAQAHPLPAPSGAPASFFRAGSGERPWSAGSSSPPPLTWSP